MSKEYPNMHLIYGEARRNSRVAERYSNTFEAVHRRLRETGGFKPKGGTGRPRNARTSRVYNIESNKCYPPNSVELESRAAVANHRFR